MALTRNLLRSLSVSEEQAAAIIEAHGETVDALKSQIDDIQKKLDTANEALKTAKAEKDSLQADYDNYKSEQAGKAELHTKEQAYEALLKDAGIADKYVKVIKQATQLSTLELTKEGKLKGADKLAEQIKENWAEFITKTETSGENVGNPPKGNGATVTREEIYAKDEHGRYKHDAYERQKMIMEHPEALTTVKKE